MSALPPKADIGEGVAGCPLLTQSGHRRLLTFSRIGRPIGYNGVWVADLGKVIREIPDQHNLSRSMSPGEPCVGYSCVEGTRAEGDVGQ